MTDDLERRLHDAMDAGVAATGSTDADRAALSVRADLRRRHQRRLAAAAVVVVVTGVVAAGVSLRPDDRPVEQVTAESTTAPADPTTSAPVGDGVVVADEELPVVEGPTLAYLGYFSGRWYSQTPGQPTAALFTRTLPDGTILSVTGNRLTPSEGEDAPRADVPPWWEPPAHCTYTGNVLVEAVLPDAVGHAMAFRTATIPAGTVTGTTTLVGGDGPTPAWLVIAQAPAGTALVQVTYPGGATDEMAPVDDMAVLVAPVPAGVDSADPVVVTALAADGSEVASAPTRRPDVDGAGSELPVAEGCEVPTELPAPGAEQPADPAAAEAAVRATWDAAVGRPADTPAGDLFDDATGLGEAEAAVRERQGDDVIDSVTVPIDAVVFVDAATAYVEYTVNVPELDVVHAGRFAELVFEDGSWKVTRESVCALLATGGSPGCEG